MRTNFHTTILFWALVCLGVPTSASATQCPAFLDHDLRKLHSSESVNLCDLAAGQALVIVNTASHCGFTGQFEGLEALHRQYEDQGLVVVGFASDDFRQEAATEEEAASVCFKNFGVTFTMIAPTSVTGDRANPVFSELNRQTQPPRWNFFKYVVNPQGEVIARFPSSASPQGAELKQAVERALGPQSSVDHQAINNNPPPIQTARIPQ